MNIILNTDFNEEMQPAELEVKIADDIELLTFGICASYR